MTSVVSVRPRKARWRDASHGAGVALAVVAALAVSSCQSSSNTSPQTASSNEPPAVTLFTDVPQATCGPGSVSETGLQGQVPPDLRKSGFQGFRCNLELLSHYSGEGAEWVGAWYKNCFYMSTVSGPKAKTPGVAVIDASDTSNIKYVKSLTSPAMLNPWETLKVNQKRGLLAGTQFVGQYFDVYDVSKDCTSPTLEASIPLGGKAWGHEGNWAPDGMTYYADPTRYPNDPNVGFIAIDVSNPTQPKVLLTYEIPTVEPAHIHGLAISADGNRAYLMIVAPNVGAPGNSVNGMMIVDVSQIQQRKPNPQVKVISYLQWLDGDNTQMVQEFVRNGRTYVVATDEVGSQGLGKKTCDGFDAFALARLIDVNDPRNPTVVSKLQLQVQNPKNCNAALQGLPSSGFTYDAHYCSVDDPQNATAVACSYFESGIRVFDIRDPLHPKEIAYYNPPANPANTAAAGAGSPASDPTADWAGSWFRWFHASDGSWQLWTQTEQNGAQILKFTNGAYPLK